MKWLIWALFGVLAALWTGGAWLVAALLDVLAGMTVAPQGINLGELLARVALPAWLSYWIEVHGAWVHVATDALSWLLKTAGSLAPSLAAALSWLVRAVWLFWGLGMAVMLLLAGGLHVLVGRVPSPPAAVPPAA